MSKVKSRIFTIITVILILILIAVGYKAYKHKISLLEDINDYERNLYSLEDIEKMLSEVRLPEKYKLKETILYTSNNVEKTNEYYINEKNTYNQITTVNIVFELIELVKNRQNTYMYEGKEKLNDKNCIKISFSTYSQKTLFYIDEDLHCIYKMEYYLKEKVRKPITKKINYVYEIYKKHYTYNYDYILDIS